MADSFDDARHVEFVHRDLQRRIRERIVELAEAWAGAVAAGNPERMARIRGEIEALREVVEAWQRGRR